MTNQEAADWHNETYGSDMSVNQFYYYHWWKNPHWGKPRDTIHKVKQMYATGRVYAASPVLGAAEGLQKLKDMGYRLVVVTARERAELPPTEEWLEKYFPDVFHDIVCTGSSFTFVGEGGHQITTKMSKVQACQDLGAQVLIDDSIENALIVAGASPPIPVLLFGEHQWNKRVSEVRSSAPSKADGSSAGSGQDESELDVTQMSFEERLQREGGHEWWKDEEASAQEQIAQRPIHRVKNWDEVVRWVEQNLQPKDSSG
ncbi:hypothetical protein PUNSTDRAFT_117170 [Punctularia strigosozonata HHB-11173 SS5]|uniref:uncharacterized protein n=1 Tax=Punctularia strigosozonata (strain HHB-11173) TaxID=741275 RepID=UPI00044173CF|nr:uncharacterized protein PUNSTDRAFT_117170 [Punctularia strigosozonata HHB-11173 SS5]EIN13376.1 hypothetical protein PUNSTDRAFT_117170 [Punctularia strigosozonata HHB-11173 SS5]